MNRIVLNSRPKSIHCELSAEVHAAGAHVVEVPMVELFPLEESGVGEAFSALQEGDVALFTSGNGIRFLYEAVGPVEFARVFSRARAGVIGQKSAEALRELGVEASFVASRSSAEEFAKELVDWLADLNSDQPRLVFFKARSASDALETILSEAGFSVESVVTYASKRPDLEESSVEELRNFLESRLERVLTFSSSECLSNFISTLEEQGLLNEDIFELPAAVIGSKTEATAREAGFKAIHTSAEADVAALGRTACSLPVT